MERRNRKQEKKNPKQVSHRKVNLREGACYCWGNPGHISPDCPEAASSPKDKCALKTATQNLCAESQKAESQSGNKKNNQLNMKKKIYQRSAHGQQ